MEKKRPEVTHQPSQSFIVNAASHYSSEYHRAVTAHAWSPVTPSKWKTAVDEGLAAWFENSPLNDDNDIGAKLFENSTTLPGFDEADIPL